MSFFVIHVDIVPPNREVLRNAFASSYFKCEKTDYPHNNCTLGSCTVPMCFLTSCLDNDTAEVYLDEFKNLSLTHSDINKLRRTFDLIGNNRIHIHNSEICCFLNIEISRFTLHMFDAYDTKKLGGFLGKLSLPLTLNIGNIYFRDFVLVVWDFCTLEKLSLGNCLLLNP
jgi:hypothetical protein